MYLRFYFPYRIGTNLQQAVYLSQLFLGLCTLTHGHLAAIFSAHLSRDYDLALRNAHDFVPPDVGVLLELQAILGYGDDPIGQHGQVQVCLDAAVGLVVDGAYVKVGLQDMEGLMRSFT